VSFPTSPAATASSSAGVADPDRVEQAARAALAGTLVVIPTDTVYGIGTRPDDAAATARLFEAKRRPPHLELPVLVASPDAAEAIGALDDRARALVRTFWPGALTVVVSRTESSAAWSLGGDPETIGLRMPDHATALALLDRTGPLAVTSANISGRPTPATCDELRALFGSAVEVYLCDEGVAAGVASTVVEVSAADVRILRQGAIPASSVLEVLTRGG
jgi:L-threonylcarbamoyladenylate synthase